MTRNMLDTSKLEAEIAKLMAETMKLHAEAAKMTRERAWYPAVVVSAAVAAAVGLTKLILG